MATAKVEQKQALRRQQILHQAAAAFNEFGYEGVSIAKLASSMGMRSSNVYYYFDSKESLLKDCYCNALSFYAATLGEIRQNSSTFTEIISEFFSFHFRIWHEVHKSERPTLAMIYEQHLLSAEARLEVQAEFDAIQLQLDECFQQGQTNGRLRTFSPQAAGDFIQAIFDWGTVWVSEIHSREKIFKISEVTTDVYLNGIATHHEPRILSELSHLDMCDRIIQRAASLERDCPSKDIISRAATRLFNSEGYEACSIDMICAEVGLTKGSFYHHFSDKNELLKYSFQQAFAFNKYLYQEVTRQAKNGLDAIKLIIQLDAMAIRDKHIQLPLFRLISKLAAEDINEAIQEVHHIRKRFLEFVAAGIHDGTIRSSSNSVIAHCYFAMKQLALRFPDNVNSGNESILDEAWDIFFHGTLKRNA